MINKTPGTSLVLLAILMAILFCGNTARALMVHTNPGLTGELPASLGKLKKISTAGPSIQVHSCNITGNIPESFAELDGGEKKVQVHVYGNQMTGVIPASVQAHKDFSSWKINPQQDGFGLTTE